MYILGLGTIIGKLFRNICFLIDEALLNIIPTLYDLIIAIGRTSPLSQANIADMASRIYKLLAVFMVFKVTFSLIMYVVNPDDFSDKSKGVSKLVTNIVISLALLVLTPYIFNYAFQLQKIVLESNALATVIFGEKVKNTDNNINTMGDRMAYIAISPFISPNLNYFDCTKLYEYNASLDKNVLNDKCFGFKSVRDYMGDEGTCSEDATVGNLKTLCSSALENTDGTSRYLTKEDVQNFAAGVEYGSHNLLFRKSLISTYVKIDSTDDSNNDDTEIFAFEYNYIISALALIAMTLFLTTVCMDIGLRSIKLAFLQLIAPIPILSYIDPKSGKDGMFKKWWTMCLKSYLYLFGYLLVLYFAVYAISMVSSGNIYDVIDGSYVTNKLVILFVTIGALMFTKSFFKILEDLGIKFDTNFRLQPLKKFQEQALGGKAVMGAAGGALAGVVGGAPLRGKGAITGRLASLGTGALRGGLGNKGFGAGLSSQADANRRMREARILGASFWGSHLATAANTFGLDYATLEATGTQLHREREELTDDQNHFREWDRTAVQGKITRFETEKKKYEDSIKGYKQAQKSYNDGGDIIGKIKQRAEDKIRKEHAGGAISAKYDAMVARADYYSQNVGNQEIDAKGRKVFKDNTGRDLTFRSPGGGAGAYYEDARGNKFIDNGAGAYVNSTTGETINASNIEEKIITAEMVGEQRKKAEDYLNNEGIFQYIHEAVTGNGKFSDGTSDKTLANMYNNTYKPTVKDIGGGVIEKDEYEKDDDGNDKLDENGNKILITVGKKLHNQQGAFKQKAGELNNEIIPVEQKISDIDVKISEVRDSAVYKDRHGRKWTYEDYVRDSKERDEDLKRREEVYQRAQKIIENNLKYGQSSSPLGGAKK